MTINDLLKSCHDMLEWYDELHTGGKFPTYDTPGDFREAVRKFEKEHSGKDPAAVALGSVKTAKKSASSKENGKKGGRPPKKQS